MRKFFWLMMAIPGLVVADSVHQSRDGREVVIKFDEPVVPLSVVQNSRNDKADAEAKGLNLFDVTGCDAQYLPEARWIDQDRLKLTYRPGFAGDTVFRVSFCPGADKYLSGAKMPQSSFEFSCNAQELSRMAVNPGLPRAATCVYVPNPLTKAQIEFSHASPVTYVFREVVNARFPQHDSKRYGRTVPGVASPALVRHLPPQQVLRLVCKKENPDEIKQAELAGMTLDTAVPGYVLVQAEDVLPGSNDWELVADGDVGSDLVENTFSVPRAEALQMAVSSAVAGADGKEELRLRMTFNAPVFKNELPEIFRRLELKVGEAVAVNSEDGGSKTITLPNGQTLIFTLQKPQREKFSALTRRTYNPNSEETGTKNYSYNPPYTDSFEVVVSGTASLPQLLDVCMPAGERAMLGARNTEPERVRLSLTPAWPSLSGCVDMMQPVLLPLKGEHKLRMSVCNNMELQVSAARLTPELLRERHVMLNKPEYGRAEELREALYELALLRTQRGISGMGVDSDNIRNAERRVRNLRPRVPDFDYLRSQLKGAEFTAPRQPEVVSTARPGLNCGEVVIDMDTVAGGKAAPGFYILSVRSVPTADVQEQLRRVGANPAEFACEQWYFVQMSDLNIIAGNGAVGVTRLSDGTPVQNATLECGETVPVQNGVAIVPRAKSRAGRLLLLTSGEDYRFFYWGDNGVRLEDDARLELVRDRGTYRPGETVHMRGILRSVSPQGVASIPSDRTVNFSVNRPNGTRLLEKKLTVNEYGAFEVAFTLPEGDEDVTGSYRVLARKDDFRAYSYINCQVFRRDSFEVESELTMQPIRPTEYSVKVAAKDLNGTPLSGGKLELWTQVLQSRKQDGSTSQTHNLTLGADGTATFTAKLPELQPGDVNNQVCISGEVRNDREEVLRVPACSRAFYPADFTAELKDCNILMLNKVVPYGEKVTVLEREQKVHLRLRSRLPREHEMPNGIVVTDTVPLTLWEGDITVPAHAVNGVPTGLQERWQRFAESLEKGVAQERRPATPPMVVELAATDAAGRKMEQKFTLYSPWPRNVERQGATGRVQGGCVKLSAPFTRAGQALVLLRSVQGVRALPPVQLQEGANELSLPLQAGEVGNVQVSVLLPMPRGGVYTALETAALHVEVPNDAAALKVALQLPRQSVRPGEKVTLSGSVLGADGKPAEAQVTLFAVDAGMLSVDKYRVPNLLSEFTRVWVDAFNPRVQTLPGAESFREAAPPRQMRGVWNGQWLDARGNIIKRIFDRHVTYGVATHNKAMGRAFMAKRSANATWGAVEKGGFGVEADGALEANSLDCAVEECAEPMSMESAPVPAAAPTAATGATAPRLRTNFIPVAAWCPALSTDADGNFTTEVTLPDTLTTYKVFALALGRDGKTFGNAEGEFTVNLPVMLTPGTPLFMSMGDCLRLPLTITNATDEEGTWVVMLEGSSSLQRVTLGAKSTATLYFDYKAAREGEHKLCWKAVSPLGGDAVEGSFSVRFPAPVLKEAHHLVLQEGGAALKVAGLLAPELAGSTRGELEVLLSANPLLHLYGCMELVQNRSYPCTQYGATSMMVWMLYDRLAPFSPIMAQTEPAEARGYVTKGLAELLKCQQADGGISFWCGARQSSPWASAYVGLVLTLAKEQGFEVPADAMARLKDYLRKQLELSRKPKPEVSFSPFDLYAIGRTIGDRQTSDAALLTALGSAEKNSAEAAIFAPIQPCWWRTSYAVASLRFLAEMSRDKADIHGDFLKWMRAVGHDYRHATHWDGGWMLIALHEYLRRTPGSNATATLSLQDGQQLTLGQGMTTLTPAGTATLGELPTTLTPTSGTAYITVKARALPQKTDYPGVTEKGLQLTRIYEKRGADGVWREAREFNVGDVVRVTLTCAKSERELEYFVLEDYLPACMEAINPNVPSQAAGLEWSPWSHWFDHKEYLSYRVRGFCTRWGGRDLLNMSYYARVKRAGTSIAPPAQGQLMYEPQTYGLSPNAVIISR